MDYDPNNDQKKMSVYWDSIVFITLFTSSLYVHV